MRKTKVNKTKTVCTFCGVGCSFEVWTKDRHILKVQPVSDAPVNGISTCVKGKFGWDFVNSEDRITKPLIRQGICLLKLHGKRLLKLLHQYAAY